MWIIERRYDKIAKIGKGGNSEAFKGIIASDCIIYAPKCISLKGRNFTSTWGFCQDIKYLQRLKGKWHIIQHIDFEVSFTFCFIIFLGIELGHIHNQGTQKDGLMKKGLQKIILNFYYIYYFMILGDWYMAKYNGVMLVY